MNTIPNNSPLNDADIEKMLSSMPQLELSKKADALFYKKLQEKTRGLHEETEGAGIFSWFSFPRLAVAGSLAALVLITGGTAWSYSDSVTRGHFLYPVKQQAERVELAFAFSSLAKIDTHLRFSDRRLEEAEEIIRQSPDLAFLFDVAFAHGDEIHLDSESAINLALTLADMRSEVEKASEIVVAKIVKPEEAERALAKIETAADKHVYALIKAEKQAPEEAKAIVNKAAREENDHLALVVEAKEEMIVAVELKKETIQVVFREPERAALTATEEPKAQAVAKVDQILTIFEALPMAEKQVFESKVERVVEALENEKYGKATGLSRALIKTLENEAVAEKQNKIATDAASKKGETSSSAAAATAANAVVAAPTAATAAVKMPESALSEKNEPKKPQVSTDATKPVVEPVPASKPAPGKEPVKKPLEEASREPTKKQSEEVVNEPSKKPEDDADSIDWVYLEKLYGSIEIKQKEIPAPKTIKPIDIPINK